MSNVPAYPKNPVLVHETLPEQPFAISRPEDEIASESTPAAPEAIDFNAYWRSFSVLVQHDPIRVVLVAAGIGILAGAMVRK